MKKILFILCLFLSVVAYAQPRPYTIEGKVKFTFYKNNSTRDSTLSTDSLGNLVLKLIHTPVGGHGILISGDTLYIDSALFTTSSKAKSDSIALVTAINLKKNNADSTTASGYVSQNALIDSLSKLVDTAYYTNDSTITFHKKGGGVFAVKVVGRASTDKLDDVMKRGTSLSDNYSVDGNNKNIVWADFSSQNFSTNYDFLINGGINTKIYSGVNGHGYVLIENGDSNNFVKLDTSGNIKLSPSNGYYVNIAYVPISDTNTIKPIGIDGSGNLKKLSHWSGGGSTDTTLAGDVTGYFHSSVVNGLLGNALPSIATGTLQWNGSAFVFAYPGISQTLGANNNAGGYSVTNLFLDGSTNTLSNITNASLVNHSITATSPDNSITITGSPVSLGNTLQAVVSASIQNSIQKSIDSIYLNGDSIIYARTNGTTLPLRIYDVAKNDLRYAPIFTLTTTGTSGASTYSGGVLNIPSYSGGGGGADSTAVHWGGNTRYAQDTTIGTNNNYGIILKTNNTPAVYVDRSGAVGIGHQVLNLSNVDGDVPHQLQVWETPTHQGINIISYGYNLPDGATLHLTDAFTDSLGNIIAPAAGSTCGIGARYLFPWDLTEWSRSLSAVHFGFDAIPTMGSQSSFWEAHVTNGVNTYTGTHQNGLGQISFTGSGSSSGTITSAGAVNIDLQTYSGISKAILMYTGSSGGGIMGVDYHNSAMKWYLFHQGDGYSGVNSIYNGMVDLQSGDNAQYPLAFYGTPIAMQCGTSGTNVTSYHTGSGIRLMTNDEYNNNTARAATSPFSIGDSITGSALNGSFDMWGSASGYTRFVMPTSGGDITYTLPNAQSVGAKFLMNDGSGNWSWAAPIIGNSYSAVGTATTTFTVTIGTTMANNTYTTIVQPTDGLALGGYVQNKTTTTFDYVVPAATGTITFDWHVKP